TGQSGLPTHNAATENASSCMPMKSSLRFWNWKGRFTSLPWMQSRKTSPLFEIALVFVRFDHVATLIINANHRIVRPTPKTSRSRRYDPCGLTNFHVPSPVLRHRRARSDAGDSLPPEDGLFPLA